MISELLKRPFPKESVHFRAGATDKKKQQRDGKDSPTAAIALAYVDARDVMDRLDEVAGPDGWEDNYFETASGRIICNLGIDYPGRGMVWKSDGAGDTGTEGEKGAISDAFKRAGVKHGVARYLYRFPNKWYPFDGWKFLVGDGYDIKEFQLPKGATEKEWKLSLSRKINKEQMQQTMIGVLAGIGDNDPLQVKECVNELTDLEQGYLWKLLSSAQQSILRKLLEEKK